MDLTEGFWRGRRVLVTGHTGFKGSWLCLWLNRLGAQVSGFSDGLPTSPCLFSLAGVGDVVSSNEGDVRDLPRVTEVMEREHPEIVIHMAAQSLVRRALRAPVETYSVNVLGTVHVLEAAVRSGGPRVVLTVTSDKCYENRGWVWGYRENEPLGGEDPYSSSKACAELVAAAYRRSFANGDAGARIASARAGNVIGGGDFAEDRLVPDLMRAALDGRAAPIRNPSSVRPWQHVLNPLSGYLMLAERLWEDDGFAEAWNFGPADGDAWPVRRVAERLSSEWGSDLWTADGGEHPPEAGYLEVDSAKARSRLGWAPVWELEQALDSTVRWYASLRDGADMRTATVAEIDEFSEAAAGLRSR